MNSVKSFVNSVIWVDSMPVSSETKASIVAFVVANIALEYGLEVKEFSPEIIFEIMKQAFEEKNSVRPERYHIDELLEDALLKAVTEGMSGPLLVGGDSPSCRSL